MRLQIRQHFLSNPCFTVFEGLSPANAAENAAPTANAVVYCWVAQQP